MKSKKSLIIVFIIIILLLILGLIIKTRKSETKIESNNTVSEFKVNNVKFNNNKMTLTLTNTTSKLQYIDSIIITLKDKDDEILETLIVKVMETLGINDSKELAVEYTIDKNKVKTYEYMVKQ
jgi:lysophospholipid acyltransferase (LPLAT)-like uncharacterized protein